MTGDLSTHGDIPVTQQKLSVIIKSTQRNIEVNVTLHYSIFMFLFCFITFQPIYNTMSEKH